MAVFESDAFWRWLCSVYHLPVDCQVGRACGGSRFLPDLIVCVIIVDIDGIDKLSLSHCPASVYIGGVTISGLVVYVFVNGMAPLVRPVTNKRYFYLSSGGDLHHYRVESEEKGQVWA